MEIKKYLLISSFLMFCIISGCMKKEKADLLVINTRIYTVDSLFSVAEAFAVREKKFVAVGSTREILKYYTSENILDASDKVIYPGFIDAHCHFYHYGTGLRMVDLIGTYSFEDVIEKLKDYSDADDQEWIKGFGWDQNDWEIKKFPDRKNLDLLFPDKPVILTRIDGHAALVNGKALEMAGITASSKIEGGEIVSEKGRLTGILIDAAVSYVESLLPRPGKEEIEKSLMAAQENCLAVGLTSLHDAGLDKIVIEILDEMRKDGKLKIRLYVMLTPSDENIENYLRKGILKNEYLHIRSVKLFADGALGSRGARLMEPYSDNPTTSGLWVSSHEYIKNICALADSHGYQVNTHCIGDKANHEILKIYSTFLDENNDKRWRIEHAQVIAPEDFGMFGRYNIVPSVQTVHATSDMYWAPDRLGEERIKNAYAYKRLLDQNGWIPNGSDFPVENINPLNGFYAAVVRKDRQSYPPDGFQAFDALSRPEALRAMTIWAARAAFEENEKGSIETGKYADFVICDNDIMTIPEEMIFRVKVEKTFISGEKVFGE